MSIVGLTIDYGPYGWLDDFDPTWTPNTTDAGGRRYRYGQQPAVARWNLVRLAESLGTIFPSEQPLADALDRYAAVYAAESGAMTATKFGFGGSREVTSGAGALGEGALGEGALGEAERALARDAFALLYEAEVDYTLFFRALGEIDGAAADDAALLARLGDVFYDTAKRDAHAEAIAGWLRRWYAHVSATGERFEARRARMHAVNPRYVLRNYLAQQAIDRAAAGDPSLVDTLLDVMRRPYDEQPEHAAFAARRPEWARNRAGCSMLSCSS